MSGKCITLLSALLALKCLKDKWLSTIALSILGLEIQTQIFVWILVQGISVLTIKVPKCI